MRRPSVLTSTLAAALAAADEVPGGVLADGEVRFFHVGGDPVFDGALLVGEREPGHTAHLLASDLTQLEDPAPQPPAVYHVRTTSG